ncbi:3-hydroxyisobutyrate dehydrogenase [Bergeriella denitrificans]|uniref:3-hydroxyisobutyrate dehydrogenase n=1 Tax=Bergeriella denitrificans TaxID=494 RepID=A0A378UGS7_BERDE|nr:3-hydroxyisobutyrate dehydrogenase [Bergeriella denitrificans]STZ76588.1 3-hydroxyacid dehydrogenase [Bergeriella denitrificans]
MDKQPKIAFIGLGNMGAPMAANLLKKGYKLTVFDLNPEIVSHLAAQGAASVAHPLEMADADIIITMLPSGNIVKSVLLGEQGLLRALSAGTLVIDCSTTAAEDAKLLAQEAASCRIALLDAPVSGGIAGATAGTLSFLVGGAQADFERAKPILEAMGKNIFHAGGNGAGQTAKICNNMLLGVLMSATAEAIALGVKNGLDPKTLSDIMAASSGGNWVLNGYNPYPGIMENAPAARGYRGGFMSKLMLKDLELAHELADQTPCDTPMGDQARELYRRFTAQHDGDLDFSAILGLYLDEVWDDK